MHRPALAREAEAHARELPAIRLAGARLDLAGDRRHGGDHVLARRALREVGPRRALGLVLCGGLVLLAGCGLGRLRDGRGLQRGALAGASSRRSVGAGSARGRLGASSLATACGASSTDASASGSGGASAAATTSAGAASAGGAGGSTASGAATGPGGAAGRSSSHMVPTPRP
ncbi:MAG: hypothetical protein M5U28_12825 [Sandaracinaceae bacterium]|nr:hypothetical protein [Sandaracinaceae bacterium]